MLETHLDSSLEKAQILLRLVNRDDEPLLLRLFKDVVFCPTNSLDLSGHDCLTLLNFFLGYCTSDSQLQQASQVKISKVKLQTSGFFLPLLDDWFIRPLYYIEKVSESAAENLTCAIFVYATKYFDRVNGGLLRVTESELVMLIADLINQGRYTEKSLEVMAAFIDRFFEQQITDKAASAESNLTVRVRPFKPSTNPYLLQAYK
jgi:hypothetical protein